MKTPIADKRYIAKLKDAGIFDNSYEESFPQTIIAKKCFEHVQGGENKKVLLIAFDAVRADALLNIVASKNKKEYPYSENSPGSGINSLRKTGGLYYCYTGGDKSRPETLQECSTIPGFSTVLSGEWADAHKVHTNNDGFSYCSDTFLLKSARMGKKASFNATWDAFFDCLFAKEKELNMPNYCFCQSKTDFETYQNMLASIKNGDDVVFGIFDNPDNNGHYHTFKNSNNAYVKAIMDSDRYAYDLTKNALENNNEDWLIMIVTDHGGHAFRHGTMRATDRITFIASNKKMKQGEAL